MPWSTMRTDTRTGDRHKNRSGDRHKPRSRGIWQERIIGVDGEGWGTDEYGRQNYMLMIAADETGWSDHLYTGKRLQTEECLEFLFSLPKAHLTSYVFSYDVSQIFRDIPYETQNRIFDNGFDWPAIYWNGWGLQYVGHKMLRIHRKGQGNVTIYDAIGFWQQSYVKTVTSAKGINPDTIDIIKRGKARRGGNTANWQQELEYSIAECSTLSAVQKQVYSACLEAGYPLSSFYGAGSLAKAMLRKHKIEHALTPKPARFQPALDIMLEAAYFGGRFETIGVGRLDKIWSADIHNAYPHAATQLSCLHDAVWRYWRGGEILDGVYTVIWRCDPSMKWGPFPARDDKGRPCWPMEGKTVVHAPELREVMQNWPGVDVQILNGYNIVYKCSCRPFEWLREAYTKRLEYKASGDPKEKVFKLGPNAVYGALAQKVGKPKYRSIFYAGMITSITRTKLLRAIRQNPAAIAVATDSVWSTEPMDLPYTDALGDWGDEGALSDFWIVQPGLAFAESNFAVSKTRGIPKARMTAPDDAGITPWQRLMQEWEEKWNTPENIGIDIQLQRYVGLGLAKMFNNPTKCGRWEMSTRRIEFGSDKRPYFQASATRPLWRDIFPAPGEFEIYPASTNQVTEELLTMDDSPYIYDSVVDFMQSIHE